MKIIVAGRLVKQFQRFLMLRIFKTAHNIRSITTDKYNLGQTETGITRRKHSPAYRRTNVLPTKRCACSKRLTTASAVTIRPFTLDSSVLWITVVDLSSSWSVPVTRTAGLKVTRRVKGNPFSPFNPTYRYVCMYIQPLQTVW